jgi:hypothetical protein
MSLETLSFLIAKNYKRNLRAGTWWLTPIILATWEAEIRRISFKASSGK